MTDTRSGGKLIMFEIVVPDILRTGFVFGLLPGWWLGILIHSSTLPAANSYRHGEATTVEPRRVRKGVAQDSQCHGLFWG